MSQSSTKRKRKGLAFIIAGLVFIAGAAGLTAYNVVTMKIAENTANELVEIITVDRPEPRTITNGVYDDTADEPVEFEVPDYILNPSMPMPEEIIDGKKYIGTLSIPDLGVQLPVCSEWSDANLRRSPCRFEGSVYTSDMIICAHNYTRHFGGLKRLSIGDEVSFVDMTGNVFVYQVVELETIMPTDFDGMRGGDWDLTLFTCTLGGQSRVTVRCEKVE